MPYISQVKRSALKNHGLTPLDAGELNYAITDLILEYMRVQGKSYQAINDVVGALEGAKLEFYRRYAAPYEDKKILENGDVY